jgi:hypothetical protein
MSQHLILAFVISFSVAATAIANRIGTPSDRSSTDRLLEDPERAAPKESEKHVDAAQPESPIARIEREMRKAEQGLAAQDTGAPTQSAQQRAIQQLDALIRQAKPAATPMPRKNAEPKTQQDSPASAPDAPTRNPGEIAPGRTQASAPEPGEPGARLPPRTLMKRVWGHLPQREGERMENRDKTEQFLPKYELEIEQYFQRLLEEQKE